MGSSNIGIIFVLCGVTINLVVHTACWKIMKNGIELTYIAQLETTRLAEGLRFRVFYGIPLDDCVIECGVRRHCQRLVYHGNSLSCELFKHGYHSQTVPSNTTAWTNVLKKDIIVTKTPCGIECGVGMTCDWKVNRPHCSYHECTDFPNVENGRLFGNMHERGSKIWIECNPGFVSNQGSNSFAICQQNGEWSPTFVICKEKIQVNVPCTMTDCSDVNNARCVSGICYCMPHYEYNATLKICEEYCRVYSNDTTKFLKIELGVMTYLNLGVVRNVVTTIEGCADYCNNNYPEYLSIDFSTTLNNCACNKLSWRQYNKNSTRPDYDLYDRACEIFP